MTPIDNTFWESRFQAGTTHWERGTINPAFTAWQQAGAFAPGSIIIPGAGRSPEPVAFEAAGFTVTVVDLADTAVAYQRERLALGAVHQADVTTWQPATPVSAVYDQTCLCALPPALWPAYEANLRRWLQPGGRLFILFMQTGRDGGPPFDCPLEAMRGLFADWQWPAIIPNSHTHESLNAAQNNRNLQEIPLILTRP